MRWLISALSVVCLSAGALFLVSLFAVSERALSVRSGELGAAVAQYRNEDYSYHVKPPPSDPPKPPPSDTPASFEVAGPQPVGSVSECSVS